MMKLKDKKEAFFLSRLAKRLSPLLFVIATAVWIIHIPYEPDKLLKSVPHNALFISALDNPGSNMEDIITAPVIDETYNSFREQMSANGIDIDKPPVENLIKRFLGRRILLSYTPALEPAGEPALVAATWIGTDSIWLRWLFELKSFPEIAPIPHTGPRPMWMIDTGSSPVCSFAFDEGMLIACFSRNPSAIHDIMLAYDGRIPDFTKRHGVKNFPTLPWQTNSHKIGSGWVSYGIVNPSYKDQSLVFRIDELSGTLASASAMLDKTDFTYPALARTKRFAELAGITADSASALLITSQPAVDSLLNNHIVPETYEVLHNTLSQDTSDIIALGVFTGRFSGRFGPPPFRPKIPVLMLFANTSKTAGVIDTVQLIIDNLNSRFQLGLIINPAPLQTGNYSIFRIEATSGGLLSKAEPEDLPAFVQIEDWLVVSSNIESLTRLVAQAQTETGTTGTANCRWLKTISQSESTAYLWFDTDSAGKATQISLAAYSFSLMTQHDKNSQKLIRQIGVIRDWIEKIRPAGTCSIWMNMGKKQPEITLELQPATESDNL